MPGDGRSADSSEMYFRAGQILPVRIIDLPIHVNGLSEALAIETALTLHCGEKKVVPLSPLGSVLVYGILLVKHLYVKIFMS